MKIQRPNQSQLNIYNQQMGNHQLKHEKFNQKDQIHISKKAKQLQQDVKVNKNRLKFVKNIKAKVEAGEYKVDYEKTAKKMIDFWSKNV